MTRGRPDRGGFFFAMDYLVGVQTYDHFGDNAYRLTIREAKG
jgi:hypothetical protein